ncbi:uncharacterized protein LAESUDRAFT_12664 [Laetiporus sulphureus 93-53]|uniref:Uncharacterized protein n=1 Tax=Laetiporus sulphureus 93-53 TaxID=1314785 RepID=A0A165I880_9APHY|nr:uncharacterized protein LAESUDRAFT_12664 [Laetiporus sulphureus 93-53]KZT12715.1 hypothetical protein LAESUDRAFT_12664 [Laetiporus sulphureus 93-53]
MPRLFPNLGRSSKENAQDAFARHDLYEQKYAQDDYGYGYGYEQESLLAPTPTRPRMSPSKEPRIDGRAYYGEGEIPGFQRTRSYRTATDDYCESQYSSGTFPAMPYARSDETESYDPIPSHPYSPVPMVQREDSLTRLREAFADNGTYTPGTMTEATTPVPDHIPDMGQFSYGTPGPQRWRAPPVEMRTVEEVKRGPVLVDNAYGPFEGIRPVVRQAPRQLRPLPPIPPPKPPVAPAQKWEVYPAEDDEGYPSVVIAVQRGGYGQKDTYYIIPGGAPVIFEDEEGNEITRVGDFSGNYRPPRNPRPVIVQDEYGREICR